MGSAKEALLKQFVLKQLLHYDPETGRFTRLIPQGPAHVGDVAGCDTWNGTVISVCNVTYRAHRLAWLYITGKWPAEIVDHKDGDPWNNKWTNLRLGGNSINEQNQRKAQKNNGSGFLGAHRNRNKYQADIVHRGKHHYLGMFATPEAAHEAYLDAKRRMHPGCTI